MYHKRIKYVSQTVWYRSDSTRYIYDTFDIMMIHTVGYGVFTVSYPLDTFTIHKRYTYDTLSVVHLLSLLSRSQRIPFKLSYHIANLHDTTLIRWLIRDIYVQCDTHDPTYGSETYSVSPSCSSVTALHWQRYIGTLDPAKVCVRHRDTGTQVFAPKYRVDVRPRFNKIAAMPVDAVANESSPCIASYSNMVLKQKVLPQPPGASI